MKVFISWSGDQSRDLAEVLRDWLPGVLQSVRPFFTPSDIEKGARWNKDIAQELEASAFGIFCLTRENLGRPWLMFEAGALSKRIDTSRVCPVLFGIDGADLEGPLVQFQASKFSESEIHNLVKTLNSAMGDHRLEDTVLSTLFEMWWPKLNERVSKVMEDHAGKSTAAQKIRTERDILEEIIQLARLNSAANPKADRLNLVDEQPDAILYSLKHIDKLLDEIEGEPTGPLEPIIKSIFAPLKYLISLGEHPPRKKRVLDELISKITMRLADAA